MGLFDFFKKEANQESKIEIETVFAPRRNAVLLFQNGLNLGF